MAHKFDAAALRARTSRAIAPYKQQVVRLQAAQRAMSARVAGKGGDLKHTGLVLAGGAAGGALAGAMPTIAGVDSRWVAGAAVAGLGILVVKGKWGGALAMLGAGMLANAAGNATQGMIGGGE